MEENDNNKAPKFGTMADAIQHQIQLIRARQLREAMGYQHENKVPGITPAPRPRRESPASKKLASRELQVVKQKLVGAGLIKDGEWMGSPAQFKELVYSLRVQWDVENRGGYAWIDCARWAGYPTDKNSIKSAQNAGRVNPGEALGDIADTIREICLKPTK